MRIGQAEAAELIATAHELADAAREATLQHFRSGLSADNKLEGGFDPVTVADRLSEERMRAILTRRRPEDGILGEEFGNVAGSSGLTWVLDPIDGTRGYLSGTPTWGVLIAVYDRRVEGGGPIGGPIYGIVDQPYIGERFEGGLGRAEVNGPLGPRPLRARAARPLSQAILYTTFPEVGTAEEGEAFRRVSARARLTRYGMDCYAYALLAAGQIDLVIEAGLHPYDVGGPIAVIEAAGGVITDWEGKPCAMGGRVIAAANPEIHAAALALLQG